jgi:histidinol-phosphatase (PHP family)
MFKTNYHTHSKFCDGTGELEDYIISAINRGFDVLGFSGHAPLPFENDWTIPKSELWNYLKELTELKIKYKNRIIIKTGLEIDYIDNLSGPNNQYFKDLHLDYIIGSVHLLKAKTTEGYLGIDYKNLIS